MITRAFVAWVALAAGLAGQSAWDVPAAAPEGFDRQWAQSTTT